MACTIKIAGNIFDSESGELQTKTITINPPIPVTKRINVSMDNVAKWISDFSKENKNNLVNFLQNARETILTDDIVSNVELIGNSTIKDLMTQYNIKESELNIDLEAASRYNIIKCRQFKIDNISYEGRVITKNGGETFIIKDKSGVLKFLKYVQTEQTINTLFNDKGFDTEIDKTGKTYRESIDSGLMNDFEEIVRVEKYIPRKNKITNKEILDVLQSYLHHYYTNSITVGNRTINPRKVVGTILGELTNTWFYGRNMTDFEYALSNVKKEANDKYSWRLNKVDLYNIIEDYYPEFAKSYTKEAFKNLDAEQLTTILLKQGGLFLQNPKLARAKIENSSGRSWKTSIDLKFTKTTLEDVYCSGYETKNIFSPVEDNENLKISDGQYKGIRIYQGNVEGKPVYIISRMPLSRTMHLESFPSIEAAMHTIDEHVKTEPIYKNSLLTIKGPGQNTEIKCALELADVQPGQIIRSLDVKLPHVSVEHLPPIVRHLYNLTMPEFYETFRTKVPDIDSIQTPEQAAIFITTLLANTTLSDSVFSSTDVVNSITEDNDQINNALSKATSNETGYNYYYVTKIIYRSGGKAPIANLRQIVPQGTEIEVDTFKPSYTYSNTIMTEVSSFMHDKYGIDVECTTNDNLKEFSIDNNLGLENKVNSTKAFVYNNKVYINTSISDVSDLFHEISYLYLDILQTANKQAFDYFVKTYESYDDYSKIKDAVQKTYKNFNATDIEKMTIANMIANRLINSKNLFIVKEGPKISSTFNVQIFENILKSITDDIANISNEANDSDIGFNSILHKSNNENNSKQRDILVTKTLEQMIENKEIIEEC